MLTNFAQIIQILSWKHLVVIAVLIVLNAIYDFGLDKLKPTMNKKVKKVIQYTGTIVVGLIICALLGL